MPTTLPSQSDSMDQASALGSTLNSAGNVDSVIPDLKGAAESGIGKMNGEYGADQIQVLEGLEAVRKRPGMYIGGTGLTALHHTVYEVVDNSIDEAMAGHATLVDVTIQPDGSCAVADDGRGIPVEVIKHEDPLLNGRPAVEIVLTKLHAGGKFQQEGSAYKVSGGLHGVGVSCVNALSEYLDCEVYRDGQVYHIGFERGRVTSQLKCVGPIPKNAVRKRGTMVTFRPDPEIFPDITFNFETLANRLRELAFLNPGVTLRFTDERVGPDGRIRSETFKAKNGLAEYVQYMMAAKTAVAAPVYFKRENAAENLSAEIAFQYHDGYNENVLAFANNINNVDGGTHAAGFKVALTRAMNGYARKAGIIREKDPVPTGEDLREGLIAIVSVKLPNPTFNNQPKERLLNPEIEGFVSAAVGEGLESWLEEHPAEAKRLCMKGIVAAQAREAARKARELTRRKSGLEGGGMPAKLRDCKTRNVEESEIFIVEGDSAGGSATQGRNVENQAILPLKGKILNVEKARIDKMLAFEEIRTLIAALKVGIGSEMDISKLRYGKVIIMTDADVDGSHIRSLLLTFFFRQMHDLLRRGHIYVAQPPLYQLSRTGSRTKKGTYVLNGKALDDALMEIGLESAALVVREAAGSDLTDRGYEVKEVKRIEGQHLRRLVQMLRRMGELVEVSQRRGVPFVEVLAARDLDPAGMGKLPTHRVTWRNGAVHTWSEHDALEVVASKGLQLADRQEVVAEPVAAATPTPTPAGAHAGAADAAPPKANGHAALPLPLNAQLKAVIRELHENRELDKIFSELRAMGLPTDAEAYAGVQREAVTGDMMPARFAWVLSAAAKVEDPAAGGSPGEDANAEDAYAVTGVTAVAKKTASKSNVVEAANIPGILDALREIGGRGLDVKRFKGLGEMDAEQLWETTMDPTKRTLLKVTMEAATEADKLFVTLMGEEVEPRRKFIEDHALEVKNLDV